MAIVHAPGTIMLEGSTPLGPGTRCRAFVGSEFVRRGGKVHVAAGRTSVQLPPVAVPPGPDRFHVTARFVWERLESIELSVCLEGDGTDWSNWSMAQEMKRKQRHEAWARLAFGLALEPLALDVGGGTPPTLPHQIGPEHPRTAAYPWGEVGSFFDSKGGATFLRIRYANPDAAAGDLA